MEFEILRQAQYDNFEDYTLLLRLPFSKIHTLISHYHIDNIKIIQNIISREKHYWNIVCERKWTI